MAAWHFTGPPGSQVDDLGFVRPWKSDNSYHPELDELLSEGRAAYAEFWSAYFPTIVRRRKRWDKVNPRSNTQFLQRFVHKGIPMPYRKMIWMRNCPPCGPPVSTAVPQAIIDQIRLDLPRTFPDNDFLKSERSQKVLGRVLYSFAEHFPDVGYCQGLNFVAALLLLVLEEESKALDLLVHFVRQRIDYYAPDMYALRRDMHVLYRIIQHECPSISRALDNLDVGLDLFVGKWFVCCFLESLPMETVLRIWDCLIYDGDIWIFRIALSLIRSHEKALVACRSLDTLVTTFQSIGRSKAALYCHQLIQIVPMNATFSLEISFYENIVKLFREYHKKLQNAKHESFITSAILEDYRSQWTKENKR